MRQSFLIRIFILGLCIVGAFTFSHCAKEGKLPSAASAPDFTLKTLDNREITLSELKGKAILLDFWATWCGPCRESIPHLIQLYKTYQEKGLEVIGMNMDRGDINTVRHFVKSMDIPYPILVTTEDVVRNYGVTGLPTTIFIDKTGKIREKIPGFSSAIAKQMAAKAEELVSEKP